MDPYYCALCSFEFRYSGETQRQIPRWYTATVSNVGIGVLEHSEDITVCGKCVAFQWRDSSKLEELDSLERMDSACKSFGLDLLERLRLLLVRAPLYHPSATLVRLSLVMRGHSPGIGAGIGGGEVLAIKSWIAADNNV